MDPRRADLVAAAEAVRTWVQSQRTSWASGPTASFPAFHASALAPLDLQPETPAPPLDFPLATSDEVFEDRPAVLIRARIDLRAHVHRMRASLHALSSLAGPLVQRFWRVGLASAVVLGCTGTARVYWPEWRTALKAQLAAAGARADVFTRPKAADISGAGGPEALPPAARSAAPVRRTGHLLANSTPEGAHVVIDGQDRGVTPLTVKNLAVGGHGVVFRGEAGEVRRSVSIAADKTVELNESIFSGWLHVSSPIELQISEAGGGIRLDDSNRVLLSPGQHEVRFENRTLRFVEVQTLDVKPGETTSISIVPPASKLTVVASTPAEVLLDGTLIGGTPLTDYAVAVGTRELTVRNAAGAERRATLTVTVDPVRVEIDFSKP